MPPADLVTYVRALEGPWLLFDDQKDPHQLNNLLNKAAYGALGEDLERRLKARLQKIGDDFRQARYYIETWGFEIAGHGSTSYAPGAKAQSPWKKAVP